MPLFKIPIVHRFGIISHADHLLIEKSIAEETQKLSNTKNAARRNPFEVTEQFIQQFNHAKERKEKEQMIDVARKMLTRNKRKAGLNAMGSGNHVNLPLAWTELAFLVHCKEKIQEEALDILLISLDQAPLHPDQIPVLFFLAESVLYWICTDAVKQSYLYACEVKIIKLGFLTFLRLFIFHLTGLVQAFKECIFRLHTYLEGLPEREACYQSFPNILLDVRFIITTGEIICGSVKSNEEYCQRTGNLVEDVNKNVCRLQVRTACRCPRQVAEPQQKVCNISPVLRECLLVWIYVKHKIQHLDDILKHLLLREQLCNTDWIDSALGLLLLGEAAKMNMACLKVLTELGTTLVSRVGSNNIKQLIHLYCCILGDICLYGSTSEIQKAALNGYGNSSKSPNRTNAPGLLQLLQVQPATAPGDDQDSNWWIRYGAAYSLAKFCHILYGDKNQKGLRNAAWDALQKHQSLEQDTQVLGAIKVAEAELNGPINPFISGSSKTSPSLRNSVAVHFLGWRIASVLSQLCLPPVVPYTVFPRMLPQRPIRSRSPLPKQVNIEKKVARLSLRQEITLAQDHELLPDFNTRTNFNLRRIVEDQWRKELQAEMKKKEKERELQLHEKQKIETEDFSEMIKRKEEKLHKKSILSEIPS
ncbi:transmembrane protein 232 isoform X1 [Chiloscyllium plagiosum]|uniref:transmembrane protein 232 isoform X1 n=1 Tax=Chiloscyllium plagiosum TaxID=36176 RepID=UPI001CB86197|nr:transmembrane protein 232 isoform X1 [Chiloscyllium plagiosum]XP_043566390.1 transmembrane protein 232 isoform X1 [Chiloscyllium plagiosum]XP_043566397.1 transmembrane protein 232 isoform X1 [Chiloscyllium plagiosum]XP_043566407.1 transmembrane protein 232 isoform X1 [Chiloscyllium plagiosum]